MTKTKALTLLLEYSKSLSDNLVLSPEGREYKAQIDLAIAALSGGDLAEDLAMELEQAGAFIELLRQENAWAANLLFLAKSENKIQHFLNPVGLIKLDDYILRYFNKTIYPHTFTV